MPPKNAIPAAQATAGRCSQASRGQRRTSEAAQHDEGDEREVQDEDGIREDAPDHCVDVTGRFSSLQRGVVALQVKEAA